MALRVLLVDDHDVLRLSLRRALERSPELDIVGEASGGKQAIELVAQLLPDVVLVDVNMPDMGGAECTQEIKARFPDVCVVALSGEKSSGPDMLQAGASGYLLKGEPPGRLIDTLQRIVEQT